MLVTAVVIAALILAIVDLVQTRGASILGWAVVLLSIALLIPLVL